MSGKKRFLSEMEIATIKRLRAEGVPIKDIAAEYGITENTVSYHTFKGEPKPAPPTRLECLAAAYPWVVTLPVADQEEFAEQLAHHPRWMTERHIDRLIWQWRQKATATEPDPHKVSLLEAAFPWALNLPLSDRARFAHEIGNHHGTPFELAELVESWRSEAAACVGRAS